MTPPPPWVSLRDIDIHIEGAGGHRIPYMGIVLITIGAQFLGEEKVKCLALVVPTTRYSLDVPVIVGTNAIRDCKVLCTENMNIPKEWAFAFVSLQQTKIGVVKSTNNFDIIVQPMETITLSGLVRKKCSLEAAVTENTEGASIKLGVCPRVVSLRSPGKYQRVPVRLFNMSATAVTIKPNSNLCELQEVKVLRSADIDQTKAEKAQAQQHRVQTDKKDRKVDLKDIPEGINLEDMCVTDQQKQQLLEFLVKWKDNFSTDITDLGNCDLIKHEIKLTDDEPFKEPARRIPPALFEEVKEHLKEMMAAGAIRPSHSPYSSNVVIVRKKDGTIRFCVDFRKLNSKTVPDAYAIPRVEDSLHLLAGAKYFTKLDLRSGYWQVEIKDEDKNKTAFQVGGLGFYEFNRMPFGLCNAPATFQRLMERCMGELNLRDCLIYLDDVIIFSSTFEEHIERLEAVFSRLKQHNLKLKPSKCEFLRSEVTYLGHVVSEEGIRTDPEKTKAVKDWPVPKNVKEVRAYLGFTGYYRRFIKNYANIARPLNDLLVGHCTTKKTKAKKKTKQTPFVWTEAQQTAFDSLKEKLMKPPVLAYADYSMPFKLHTDASSTGLGAVLYQNQEGIDRVVAYASRSLKPSERNYPAHKLEFLALKWSVTEKFHDYLYGARFEVVTDNNPLTYVFTTAKLDATGQRWLAALSNYNCTISYRSGKQNLDADGLSRIREDEQTRTIFPDVLKTICHSVTVDIAQQPYVESLTDVDQEQLDPEEASTIQEEVINGTALSAKDWIQAQSEDRNIRFVINSMLEGCKPTTEMADSQDIDRRFIADWEKYHLKEGVLYKKATVSEEEFDLLCLPHKLRDDIFKAYHADLGHQGRDRTLSLIKRRFFSPGLEHYIKQRIQTCGRCIRRKTAPAKAAELVNITSSSPMELICIDYLCLERSKGGIENILVITDHFTRYAQAIPTRNQSAYTTAKALYENFFVHYGFPAKIHSDMGANFESKLIRKLCDIAGIQKTRTTPYHPMGNGMVERFNKTLLNMLGTLQEHQKSDWKAHVSTLTHAYNAAIHDSTGFSPYYLMFGRHPRLAMDAFLGIGSGEDVPKSKQDYSDRLKDRLQFAYKKAGEKAKKTGETYKMYYDRKVRHAVLEPGDRVLIKNIGLTGRQKLADKWQKQPYVVKKQPIPDIPIYEVEKENSSAKPKLLHRNMLLPFIGLPGPDEDVIGNPPRDRRRVEKELEIESEDEYHSESSSSDDSSDRDLDIQLRPPRYHLPGQGDDSRNRKRNRQAEPRHDVAPKPLRRGKRLRRPPERYQAGQRNQQTTEYVFYVDPYNVVYI